jgi:hypothetical protein
LADAGNDFEPNHGYARDELWRYVKGVVLANEPTLDLEAALDRACDEVIDMDLPIQVPLIGGNELLGTFARNGDLAFTVRPPVAESDLAPLLGGLAELGYVDVQLLGMAGCRAEPAAAADRPRE